MASNMSIDSRKWIIHKNDIGIKVDSSSNVQTLFLTTRDSDTSLTDFGLIAIRKHLEIGTKSAGIDNLVVPFLVEIAAKDDVLLYSSILNPCILWTEGSTGT